MTLSPFAPYYRYVRFPRFLIFLIALPLVLVPACDRGARPAQTGKPAPDFTISDGSTQIHLNSYRGQVVMLNFWASWCSPCIVELPSLLALHHDQPSLAILGVSIDEDADEYSKFLVRRHVDFLTVRDPSQSVAKLYHTEMWPETYVIDRQGVIRRKFVGAQDWSSPEVRAFLKAL